MYHITTELSSASQSAFLIRNQTILHQRTYISNLNSTHLAPPLLSNSSRLLININSSSQSADRARCLRPYVIQIPTLIRQDCSLLAPKLHSFRINYTLSLSLSNNDKSLSGNYTPPYIIPHLFFPPPTLSRPLCRRSSGRRSSPGASKLRECRHCARRADTPLELAGRKARENQKRAGATKKPLFVPETLSLSLSLVR